MWRHTRMLKGRVNTGRFQKLLIEARALDKIGLKDRGTTTPLSD